MRDKKLTNEENEKITKMDNPDMPNNISGDTIFVYKLYCSLLEQVVRLDAEVEVLKGGK
jgi:hypothetical protein